MEEKINMTNQISGFGQQPPPRISVTPDQLTTVMCESCKGEVFTEGVMLREVSALISPTGEPKLYPIPVFICLNCKEILQQYLPEAFKTPKLS